MTTKVTKKTKKKATVSNTTPKVSNNVTMTRKQAEGIASFYAKNNKKLPAFLAKKLA